MIGWRQATALTLKFGAILLLGTLIVLTAGIYHGVQAPALKRKPPLLGRNILIDPGHGGIDPGCHRDGLLEKDLVLSIALELERRLTEMGAQVTLTRAKDTELSHLNDVERTRHRRDLSARVGIAAGAKAEVFVSLHVNSAASSRMGGAMTFFHPTSGGGKRLGQDVLRELKRVVPGNQNGVLPGDYFILRNTGVPAVLVETGFISNPADRALLTDDNGVDRIAGAIASGIERYFSHSPSQDAVLPTTTFEPRLEDHECLALY